MTEDIDINRFVQTFKAVLVKFADEDDDNLPYIRDSELKGFVIDGHFSDEQLQAIFEETFRIIKHPNAV